MNLITPSSSDIKSCFELERFYSISRPEATKHGFFLPGTELSVYESLGKTGFFRVLKEDENVAAFVIAIPPGHDIVRRLLENNESLIWYDECKGVINSSNCCWIAKVAVSSTVVRKGLASRLYREVFDKFDRFNIVTATALSPFRNNASEAFHRAMGLKARGVFLSGLKEDVGHIVNMVWRRDAGGAV